MVYEAFVIALHFYENLPGAPVMAGNMDKEVKF